MGPDSEIPKGKTYRVSVNENGDTPVIVLFGMRLEGWSFLSVMIKDQHVGVTR